ncbi:MAG: hypothetical protein EPO21_05045 [Chloroflexota bacterium]|nr:MAG: hypothetical protein EPO21_05045 [Chloroflexota bacterium]
MQNPAPGLRHVYADVSAIPAALRVLSTAVLPEDGVLSIYLDTSVHRIEGRAYVLSFREGCKAVESALASADRDQRKAFEAAMGQAEQYVDQLFVPRYPGLALFASGRPEYFFAVPLPQRPAEDFTWAREPQLKPLQEALDEYERVAVAVVDKRRARLFTVFLGTIEESEEFESDVPGKQSTGDWGGMSQARYARHHEDHVLRHLRRTIRALMDLLRSHPFDRLLVAGPEEATTFLQQELPRPLRSRLAGTLSLASTASEAEVLGAALEAAEAIERQGEEEMVDELMEAATTPRATLGVDATLAALSEDRVYHLFMAQGFAGTGSECSHCKRLMTPTERCSFCGRSTTEVADLHERSAQRALEQGAHVETVSGDAEARLMEHGGVGAWTRY